MFIVQLTTFFLVGVFLSSFFTFNLSSIGVGSVILWVLAVFVLRGLVPTTTGSDLLLFFAVFLIGFWRYSVSIPQIDSAWIQFYNQQEITVTGRVITPPENTGKWQKLVLDCKGYRGKVLVYAPLYPKIEYGSVLEIAGQLEDPPVFDDFSYKDYLFRQGIYSTLKASTITTRVEDKTPWWVQVRRFFLQIRAKFSTVLGKLLPEPHAGIAVGTFLGIKRGFSEEFEQQLRDSGLIHLVVVSGSNVSTVLVALLVISAFVNPAILFSVGAVSVLMYACLVGFGYPVIRASIAGLIVLLAKALGRQRSAVAALFLSGFLICLHNPHSLWDVGFQLSFLATGGILFINPGLFRWMQKIRVLAKLSPQFREALSTTLAAQIATAPVAVFTFGQVSFTAPLANILMFWIVPFVTFASAITGFLGLLYLPLGKLSALFAWMFLEYFVSIVRVLGSIPVMRLK